MTKAGQPVFQSQPDSFPEPGSWPQCVYCARPVGVPGGICANCVPDVDAIGNEALHAQADEDIALQCMDSIAGLYPALDILCFRALQCAPYKSPMYERISKIHGMLEAACDLARREGSK